MAASKINSNFCQMEKQGPGHHGQSKDCTNPGKTGNQYQDGSNQLKNTRTNASVRLHADLFKQFNGFRLRREFKIQCLKEYDGCYKTKNPDCHISDRHKIYLGCKGKSFCQFASA